MTILFTLLGTLATLAVTLGSCVIVLLVAASTLLGSVARRYVRHAREKEASLSCERLGWTEASVTSSADEDRERSHISVDEHGIAVAHHRDERKILHRGSQMGLCRNPYERKTH